MPRDGHHLLRRLADAGDETSHDSGSRLDVQEQQEAPSQHPPHVARSQHAEAGVAGAGEAHHRPQLRVPRGQLEDHQPVHVPEER